jgi:uncharacterized coiled-coil protein SlyX
MDTTLAERLEKAEAAVAHLERLCEQLNQVVVEQGRTLTRLLAQQKQVSSTITTMELERIHATNPKPPHYQ